MPWRRTSARSNNFRVGQEERLRREEERREADQARREANEARRRQEAAERAEKERLVREEEARWIRYDTIRYDTIPRRQWKTFCLSPFLETIIGSGHGAGGKPGGYPPIRFDNKAPGKHVSPFL